MPRIIDPQEKKQPITLRIKRKNIDELKKIKGYNSLVDKLVEDYLQKKNK